MDLHQTSSELEEMPFASANEDQMVDNVMAVLPIELTNFTGTHLHQLNEDCLLEIFSRNPLTPIDLCSLAETCKRFKEITQRMFSKGFTIGCWYNGYISFSSKDDNHFTCTFQDIERILKNFGAHLSEVNLSGDLALVNLVARYCDDITLKRLEMSFFKSIGGVTQQLNSIFQRLLQLTVHLCNLPIEPWNMNCDSLIELEIWDCENGATLLTNTFPMLERFIFRSTNRKNNIEALSEFVARHGCLKSIDIRGESFDVCTLLRAISCSCNELVELTVQNDRHTTVDISHLQSLAKLEVLNIGYNRTIPHTTYCEEIDFSQAFKSLKTMQLSFVRGPVVQSEIFDILPQLLGLRELRLIFFFNNVNDMPWARLTHLRKLYLSHSIMEPSYLLDVIRQLINLEELKLGYDGLDREEFSKIVKLVERRAHVLTLRCDYDFIYEENCNETRKVKLIKL